MANMKKIVLISLAMLMVFYVGLAIAQDEPTTEREAIVEEQDTTEAESMKAVEPVKVQEKEGTIESIIRFYKDGEGWMHPILFLALFAIAIAIERAYKLWLMQRFNTQEFYVKLKTYLRKEKYDKAIEICQAFKKTTMGSIFLYGIKGFVEAKNSGKTGAELRAALQQSFDEAALNELPKLEKRIHYLDTFAQMATLMGLLAPIFGLMFSFASLAGLPPEEKNDALSKGISMAMHTTAFGLIVALPIMLVKSWLQSKASTIMSEIDEYSVKAIHTINSTI